MHTQDQNNGCFPFEIQTVNNVLRQLAKSVYARALYFGGTVLGCVAAMRFHCHMFDTHSNIVAQCAIQCAVYSLYRCLLLFISSLLFLRFQ